MRKSRLILPLLLLALMSCGINNTMYNAKKYFRAAQERPLNANGRPSPQAVEEYTKAIQKCGIILSRNKTDRKTDNALYLMARALYLKGNSAFQAKDQFEALISGFPDSPFYGEAHIYLAKVLREINETKQAVDLLERFIRDPEQRKLHPRALLTIADFAIQDKDYTRAQFWLERIIKEHPKAKEFGEAYLLFGKNYYVQEDYPAALAEFERITSQRRIPKDIRLDARYYSALNQFYLQDYSSSMRNIQELLKDEYRADKLAQAKVLRSRLLFATGDGEAGLALAEEVSKDHPRTQSSSDALYYLGEYHFYQQKDLELAGTAYGRVRGEFVTSDLAEIGQRKSTAINQLKQNSSLDPKANLQLFVDYYMAAAENYLNPFELPDSALVMYQQLMDSRQQIISEGDSLTQQIAIYSARIDSLTAVLDTLPQPVIPAAVDTLKADVEPAVLDTLKIDGEPALEDTLKVDGEPAFIDTLKVDEELVLADSLAFQDPLLVMDIGLPQDSTVVADSLAEQRPAEPVVTAAQLEAEIASLQRDIEAKEKLVEDITALLPRYEREIIPMALFSQAVVYHKLPEYADSLQNVNARMQQDYPQNKYTNALTAMLSGAPVRLIDPVEEAQEISLDHALGLYETAPDSMVVSLNQLTASEYLPVRLKANFRLGWYYTFEAADTTLAKPYLEEVLNLEKTGDYASLTRRFFNGTNFAFPKLTFPEELQDKADSLIVSRDSLVVKDSLQTSSEEDKPAEGEPKPEIGTEPVIQIDPETGAIRVEQIPEYVPEPLPEALPGSDTDPPDPPPDNLPE